MKFKSKSLLLALAVTGFLTFISCKEKQAAAENHPAATTENSVQLNKEHADNAGISTGQPEMRSFSSLIKLNGKIEVPPQNLISICVPLGGYLRSTDLLEGMQVKKGEALAIVEDQQYIQLQQDYLTAKAQFGYHESEYRRQKELNESKAASDKNFEQARALYESQNVLIKSLEQKLRLAGINPDGLNAGNITRQITIHAPVSGFVSAVKTNVGKYIMPGEAIFELIDPGDIHLRLTVFEKDLSHLAAGQKLQAYNNSHPEKKYPCKIIMINRHFTNDNAAEAHCHFDRYEKELLPGMFMNAEIETITRNISSLPEEAVVRYRNKNFVFADNGNYRYEMLEVQTGVTEAGFTEINLPPDSTHRVFVIHGAYNLLMAMKNVSEE